MTSDFTQPALGSRALFPTLEARSYLAHAAISPLPAPAVQRVQRLTTEYAARGFQALGPWLGERARLKALIGQLLGCEPSDVGLVQSTTPGVVFVAFSLDWRAGDRIIVFEGEFPANITPWQRAASTFGLELATVPIAPFFESPEAGLAAVEEELKRGARLVAVSAVRFQDGLRMPTKELGALAHRYGAELFVDAIQAAGATPLDVENVDYLACGGHKWLMGLEGAGFVYVAPSRLRALVPRLAGWLGHEEPVSFLFDGAGHLRTDRPFRAQADLSEQGAQSGASLAALQASLELILALGVPAIYAHIQKVHDALEAKVLELAGPWGLHSRRATFAEGRSGSLCFRLPPQSNPRVLARHLGEDGVAISTPDGHLRLAPHWPNAQGEGEWVPHAIARALKESVA